MTALPDSTRRKLGLVIDLDTCVGCHACVVHCKEWNTGGYPAPLSDTYMILGQSTKRIKRIRIQSLSISIRTRVQSCIKLPL